MNDADEIYEFSGYRLDPSRRRLFGPDGKVVALRAKVFDTLCVLVRRAGEPISKTELLAAVWSRSVVEENNLNQAISMLRQTFGDDRNDPAYIATITGHGYQFVASVKRCDADETALRQGTPPKHRKLRGAVVAVTVTLVVAGAVAFFLSQSNLVPAVSLDDARPVTQIPGSYSMPTLSPDGTLMAMVSDRSGTPQIWVQGLPDGKPVQITRGELPATSPSWSPVDDSILFQRATADGTQSVWVIDAVGSNPPRVVATGAWSPKFSTDGRAFVFMRNLTEVHIATLDSEQAVKLAGVPESRGFAPASPAMNAAGDIAFVLADEGPSGNLWLYTKANDGFRQLNRSRSAFAGEWASSPVWLPDGKNIIYVAAGEDPTVSHLWQADTETGDVVKLSTGVGGYSSPSVSRDGARLVYGHARPMFRLVRTDTQTGDHQTIFESRNTIALPQLSRDGKQVVFFGEHVYTMNVAGGEPEQRSFGNPGQATLPAWSRSDQTLYYYWDRALHRIDTETGLSEQVLDDFHWSSKNWLAVYGEQLAYHRRSLPPGGESTVVLDLATGEELELDPAFLPTDFSRDGRSLLGRKQQTSDIFICHAPSFDCKPLLNQGVPIDGAIPRWSADETRIFFRRAIPDKPGYADIWVVASSGGEPQRVVEVGPYDPLSMFFGVADDDSIVWNAYDRSGSSEIWMADINPD